MKKDREAWEATIGFSNYFSKYDPTPYTAYTIATSQESRASREVMRRALVNIVHLTKTYSRTDLKLRTMSQNTA